MRSRAAIVSIGLAAAAISLHAAEPLDRKAFLTAWEDRTVIVRQTLYSIVFDERSRVLPILKRQGRVTGLTVVTPGEMYYRFDARRGSEEDIIDRDPNRIVSALRKQYHRSEYLDIGSSQDVEPVLLVRYEPGVELLVRRVQIERNLVRLWLHKDRKSDLATALTVQWPAPISKELTEAPLIDELLSRYVTRESDEPVGVTPRIDID